MSNYSYGKFGDRVGGAKKFTKRRENIQYRDISPETKKIARVLGNLADTVERSGLSFDHIEQQTTLGKSTIRNFVNGNTKHPHFRTVMLLMNICNQELGCAFSFEIISKMKGDIPTPIRAKK